MRRLQKVLAAGLRFLIWCTDHQIPCILGVGNVFFENPEGTCFAVFCVAEIAVEIRGDFGKALCRFLAQVLHDFGFGVFADLQTAVQLEKEFTLGIERGIALLGVQGPCVQQCFFRKIWAEVFGEYRAYFGLVFDDAVVVPFAAFKKNLDNRNFCAADGDAVEFFDRTDLTALAHEPAFS